MTSAHGRRISTKNKRANKFFFSNSSKISGGSSGSSNQSSEQAEAGDSASSGHGVGIDVVTEISVEDVAPAQLKQQKKRKTKVADASEPTHPAKKLRDDYGAPGGPTVGGKSQSSIQHLFAGAVQNEEVRGGVIPTLPFVSSSVSTILERKGEDYTELVAGATFCAIGAPQRCEEIESLKAQLVVKETKAAEVVHLRAKASKFKIVEKSLRDEMQVLKERSATFKKEKSELEIQVTDLAASVKVREQEVADLDDVVTSMKLQND
nr:hypothetical protein [Tanacetum cinerariifolium]